MLDSIEHLINCHGGITLLIAFGISTVLGDVYGSVSVAESIVFGTTTNSPLLGLGMAINMEISKHAYVYTINDLYNDTIGKHKQLIWRW